MHSWNDTQQSLTRRVTSGTDLGLLILGELLGLGEWLGVCFLCCVFSPLELEIGDLVLFLGAILNGRRELSSSGTVTIATSRLFWLAVFKRDKTPSYECVNNLRSNQSEASFEGS